MFDALRMATSTSPLSLSLITGMEMAFVTRWVDLQKPVDLFHAIKKWVDEPKTASIFQPGIFPVFVRVVGRSDLSVEGLLWWNQDLQNPSLRSWRGF